MIESGISATCYTASSGACSRVPWQMMPPRLPTWIPACAGITTIESGISAICYTASSGACSRVPWQMMPPRLPISTLPYRSA